MLPDLKTKIMIEPEACDTNSTPFGVVDTLDFDFVHIEIDLGSASASASALADIGLCEDDTVPTAFGDGDAIVECVGGAAIDATHGFVFPKQGSNKLSTYEFNLDLRGRKRYIGCKITEAKDAEIAMTAHLFRGSTGPAQKVVDVTADGCRLLVNA